MACFISYVKWTEKRKIEKYDKSACVCLGVHMCVCVCVCVCLCVCLCVLVCVCVCMCLLNGGCRGGNFRSLDWSDRLLLRVTVLLLNQHNEIWNVWFALWRLIHDVCKVQFIPHREQLANIGRMIDVTYRNTHNCCSLLLLCPLCSSLICLHFVSRICAIREVRKNVHLFVTLYQRLNRLSDFHATLHRRSLQKIVKQEWLSSEWAHFT